MNIDDYQKQTGSTAVYKDSAESILSDDRHKSEQIGLLSLSYLSLGLSSEVGEVCGKIKKIIRDKDGIWWRKEEVEGLSKEIGDVMYYLSEIANLLGVNLSVILQENADKLKSRMERGVIGGNGDNR